MNKDGPQARADGDKATQAASQSTYESQLSLKQKLKTMLENEKLIPKVCMDGEYLSAAGVPEQPRICR